MSERAPKHRMNTPQLSEAGSVSAQRKLNRARETEAQAMMFNEAVYGPDVVTVDAAGMSADILSAEDQQRKAEGDVYAAHLEAMDNNHLSDGDYLDYGMLQNDWSQAVAENEAHDAFDQKVENTPKLSYVKARALQLAKINASKPSDPEQLVASEDYANRLENQIQRLLIDLDNDETLDLTQQEKNQFIDRVIDSTRADVAETAAATEAPEEEKEEAPKDQPVATEAVDAPKPGLADILPADDEDTETKSADEQKPKLAEIFPADDEDEQAPAKKNVFTRFREKFAKGKRDKNASNEKDQKKPRWKAALLGATAVTALAISTFAAANHSNPRQNEADNETPEPVPFANAQTASASPEAIDLDSPTAPASIPSAESLNFEAFTIPQGGGGEKLMENLGRDAADWYTVADDLAEKFPAEFYKTTVINPNGSSYQDVRIRHNGELPEQVQQYIIAHS